MAGGGATRVIITTLVLLGLVIFPIPPTQAVIPEYNTWYKVFHDFHFYDMEFDPQDPDVVYGGAIRKHQGQQGHIRIL